MRLVFRATLIETRMKRVLGRKEHDKNGFVIISYKYKEKLCVLYGRTVWGGDNDRKAVFYGRVIQLCFYYALVLLNVGEKRNEIIFFSGESRETELHLML